MKSILYAGATLMIGASIYGFVDYNKTSHQKEFTSMYEIKKKNVPVVIIDKEVTTPLIKKDSYSPERQPKDRKVINEKKEVTTKHIVSKETVNAPIKPIAANERLITKEEKKMEIHNGDIILSKDSDVEKKVKKKKKLNSRLFSRAPLRDKEEINLVQPPKTEIKKPEIKEQK